MPANYQQLHADLNRTLGRTQLANDAPAPIVADIISSKAPPLPKEIAEDLLNENKNRLVRTAIDASRADPVLAATLENAFAEALSKVESNASYKTVLHRRRILTLWAIIIDDVTNGQVKGEDVWNVKVVQEHARRLLYVLARDLRGRDGKSPIKAVTLRGLFADSIYCIAKYTRDDNGDRCGMALLTRGSLFETLDNDCSAWVDEFELECSPGDKIMYGKEELKMLIEEALKNTERRGRDLAIQNCLFMVLSAITGLRPSSFAPSDKKLKEKKKYPIIQNVKVNLIGPLAFSSRLVINHLKGHNGDIAARVSFALEPVKYWYNVIFDPTVWFLCFFIMRDVLDKSVDDVEKHTDFTFGYTPGCEKQPLFLKGAQGHFPEEVEVTTSKQLSQAVSKTAQNRGMAWTGSYAFRRAIATLWAKILNSEHADRLLAHGLDAGSLHNYVDGSSTHDLVAVALLERALTDEARARLALGAMRGQVVIAAITLLEPLTKKKDGIVQNQFTSKLDLTTAQKEEINASTRSPIINNGSQPFPQQTPIMQKLVLERYKLLDELKALLIISHNSNSNAAYEDKGQIKRLLSASVLKDGVTEEQRASVRERLCKAFDDEVAMRRQLCRELVLRLRQDGQKMLIDYDGGSLAERKRAQHDAEQPSSILQDIIASTDSTDSTAAPTPAASDDVDSFHQRATNYLRTRPLPTGSDTSVEDLDADYMINIDEDDYDDPEDGCHGLIKVLRAEKIDKEKKGSLQDLSAKIELARKQKMSKTASGSGNKEKAVEDGDGDGDEVEVLEVDGDVSGPAEFEQDEETPDSSIDVGQVRLAFMRRVLAPIMEEREMKKWFEEHQGWVCGKCKRRNHDHNRKDHKIIDRLGYCLRNKGPRQMSYYPPSASLHPCA